MLLHGLTKGMVFNEHLKNKKTNKALNNIPEIYLKGRQQEKFNYE
jgi:hypothetical protein